MKAELLRQVVQKIYLNGLNGECFWQKTGDVLESCAVTDNNKLFSLVSLKDFYPLFDDIEFPIYDTERLLKFLTALDNEYVDVDLTGDKVKTLEFTASKISAQYVIRQSTNPKPRLKNLPQNYEVSIVLDKKFVQWLMGKNNKFAYFTVFMNQDRLEMAINHKNGVLVPQTLKGLNVITEPLSFDVRSLKEIIKANTEFRNLVLNVSEKGLAHVSCHSNHIEADYYFVSLEVDY